MRDGVSQVLSQVLSPAAVLDVSQNFPRFAVPPQNYLSCIFALLPPTSIYSTSDIYPFVANGWRGSRNPVSTVQTPS
ncbi:hypothetical protein AOLI_G00221900 [Acnodon oligacanthus]